MNKQSVDSIPLFIGASGALAAAVTFAVAGVWMAYSAAVGAVIALANFYAFRWIADRVTRGSVRKRVVFGLITALIMFHWVDPIGLVVGLSALVVGLLSGSIRYFFNTQSTSSE
jgi:predicted PurR-regulated permease PerM